MSRKGVGEKEQKQAQRWRVGEGLLKEKKDGSSNLESTERIPEGSARAEKK